MISYLWPEGMMQYTVVGAEASAADPNDRPDLVFKTSDGYITVGTISDSEWRGFCQATGDAKLSEDPRFATPSARSMNAKARINLMAEYIEQHTTAEWLRRLDEADVPCAPILRRGEVMHNEQVVARGLMVEFDQPTVGKVRQPRPAARFDVTEANTPRAGSRHRRAYARRAARSRLLGVRRRSICRARRDKARGRSAEACGILTFSKGRRCSELLAALPRA